MAVKNFMAKAWNFVTLPDMYYHEEGYFLLRFKNHYYMDAVMMKGPCTIRKIPMILKEWRPDYNVKEDMLRTLPIWVTLPKFPLHLWGPRSLNKIGSMIGIPLVTDECRAHKLRVSYARILVEVDITRKLIHEITIKDLEGRKIRQPIEYEWRPKFCEKCQKGARGFERPPSYHRKCNMIISWNVRGLNKSGKLREISSRILELKPGICILIETRVKNNKAINVRNKLNLPGKYIDDYPNHTNGRIWIVWNDENMDSRFIHSSSQHIHCGVYNTKDNFKYWRTTVYAHNQLDLRRTLWNTIVTLHHTGPWYVIEDYNNVLTAQDRIGGNLVREAEYEDLHNMMENTGLGEMDSIGDFFTWTNKQSSNPIYSKLDRILANVEWFHRHSEATLHILPPNVSDHAPKQMITGKMFKFNNHLTEMDGYEETVRNRWNEPARGRPMNVLWHKLQRLKYALRSLQRKDNDIRLNLARSRSDLQEAQASLMQNLMDTNNIKRVKKLTEEVLKWNLMEEKTLLQRTKIDWLKSGDGNNTFFYAYLKT
ncbi:uncharacterized protein LOC131649972 [Vicia villosa]|uniref:uncharacterized protein LOC131649972 n=1 Tax=Vicia villosa TaxID=3911 RepID=UPI00273C323F|nr:uncharacterized protein LOC131649972 [Vicia villosa]